MTRKDYYQILGVPENASQKQIKEAFRRLALEHHPDRNRDAPASAERMKAVNEAYAVLSNPRRRAEYDTLRQQFGETAYTHFRSSHSEQDLFRGSDINQIFEELARSFGLRGVDEIFKDVYGPGYRSFEFRRPGMFGRGFIFVSGFGGPRRQAPGDPPLEGGGPLGRLSQRMRSRIAAMAPAARGRDIRDTLSLPADLARQGGAWAYHHKPRHKKLVVRIPAGVREGQQIRLAGMGMEGRGGGPPGDLLLKVVLRRSLAERIKGFLGRRGT